MQASIDFRRPQAPAQDSWNGELLGYVVTWREAGGFEGGEGGRETTRGGSGGEVTLAGLRGGARLGVAVRAFSRAGAGPASPEVYATVPIGGEPSRFLSLLSNEFPPEIAP